LAILVVGGSGYIGSHAVRALRRHGFEPIIYDNLSTGYELLARGSELIVGDIGDRAKLLSVLPRVDAIMHFAAYAYVGESVQNPEKYFSNNVESALTLLNAAKDCGITKFVFSSTCAVYGTPASVPIDESTARQPINPYGASKLFFENALEAYDRAYGMRYASLRYFNAAGADESGEIGEMHVPETHLIPLVLAAAAGTAPPLEVFGTDYPTPDGTCIRDYIHVNDLAEAHVLALKYLEDEKQSFAANLGTGRGFSVLEVIAAVERVTGLKVPRKISARRPGDPPALVANASRAEKLLNWKANRTLDEIVSTAWNWMRRQSGKYNEPAQLVPAGSDPALS
jgi:UDP-glucose-4-epimerase GalE